MHNLKGHYSSNFSYVATFWALVNFLSFFLTFPFPSFSPSRPVERKVEREERER